MKNHKNIIFVLVTVFTILVQLINPTFAYADDGQPPVAPAESGTEVAPPEEPVEPLAENPLTEVLPVELPAATEEPVEIEATPQPEADSAPVDDPNVSTDTIAAEELTVSEIIEQIPTGTDIVVLDGIGNVLPLATQEAAEIITNGDPIWCPDGVNPGGAGCSPSYKYFTKNNDDITPGGLIGWLNDATNATTVSKAGKIWIAYNYSSAIETSIDINGSSVAGTMENFVLTLQGGWDGAFNSLGTITATNSVFSVPITISNWNNDIDVKNIAVNNGLTLNNIQATSGGKGSYINILGDVTINNSEFSNNNSGSDQEKTGLTIITTGNISLYNITANNNATDGAFINTSGNVTIDNSTFSGNRTSPKSGLAIFNAPNVTITNSTFVDNYYGAFFGNYGNIGNAVIIDSVFSQNLNTGLFVSANGNITLKNVTANGNANAGVFTRTANGKSITIDTITANNNCTGLHTVGSNDVHVTAKSITGNRLGFLVDNSSNSYYLKGGENVTGNTVNITGYSAQCSTGTPGRQVTNLYIEEDSPDSTTTTTTTPAVIEITTIEPEEFTLDCLRQDFYPVNLPNGDQVQVVCPVSGKARISRMDSTTLPADLPAGYTYSSAFSLDIIQKDNPISFVSEGGHIKASFQLPSLQAGDAYSVLYWDNDKWVPLKDFMLDENGTPRSFDLHPDDPRLILSGLNFVFTGDSPRAEISTNFPGIFVLAQR